MFKPEYIIILIDMYSDGAHAYSLSNVHISIWIRAKGLRISWPAASVHSHDSLSSLFNKIDLLKC